MTKFNMYYEKKILVCEQKFQVVWLCQALLFYLNFWTERTLLPLVSMPYYGNQALPPSSNLYHKESGAMT